MQEPKINSATHCFIALFEIEQVPQDSMNLGRHFHALTPYESSKAYYDQKYYSNWLHSFFGGLPSEGKRTHHLQLNTSNILYSKQEMSVGGKNPRNIEFSISAVNLYFFEGDVGILVIKTSLPREHLNWEDINDFGSIFRQTPLFDDHHPKSLAAQLIEEHITPHFQRDPRSWRKLNPNLKSAIFIDLDQHPGDSEMNRLLFQLGTFSLGNTEKGLFHPNPKYMLDQIEQNQISLFTNWKALCLHDSVSRIAIGLESVDTHRLWESEYLHIYLYVLYARYFLQHTNNQLKEISNNPGLLQETRKQFFRFVDQFNYHKIAHKHLPNEIYKQLKQSLEIEEELNSIQEKLTRLNLMRQERYERRVNRILFMLTSLTLISVAYDAGQMLKDWVWSRSLGISLFLLLAVGGIMTYILVSKRE